jgi:hypothetical protein
VRALDYQQGDRASLMDAKEEFTAGCRPLVRFADKPSR